MVAEPIGIEGGQLSMSRQRRPLSPHRTTATVGRPKSEDSAEVVQKSANSGHRSLDSIRYTASDACEPAPSAHNMLTKPTQDLLRKPIEHPQATAFRRSNRPQFALSRLVMYVLRSGHFNSREER